MSAHDPKHSEAAEAAWARRKTWNETWTRSDTERWLDERSTDAAAWVRTIGITLARDPKQMGNWMRTRLPGNFDTAHTKLAARTHTLREKATTNQILPSTASAAVDSEPPFEKRA